MRGALRADPTACSPPTRTPANSWPPMAAALALLQLALLTGAGAGRGAPAPASFSSLTLVGERWENGEWSALDSAGHAVGPPLKRGDPKAMLIASPRQYPTREVGTRQRGVGGWGLRGRVLPHHAATAAA